ncbi:hypothetical protein [Sorangium cellulosum]|uniref:Uncharacterized protein n=1 Tax=Sorangium cellulosum So0157-2 TaxID=1254432 RepID=S4XTF0_SORCE|nr:hypothetical protein [Sorangium cellulosum]AGP36437.1 hypothetical protein SCE1572_19245 [Sorangium cellulosum So0157-2]
MPLNGLEFVERDLLVQYQASRDPQELRIHIETGAVIHMKAALIALRGPFDWINFGVAGGAEFPPWESRAEEMGFDFLEERPSWGPGYDFTLRVQCVSHRFIRLLIESLRISGWGNPVRRMVVVGSLPIQDPATSVTERDIRAAIHDPTAYPGAWPERGFPIELLESVQGVTVEIELVDKVSPSLQFDVDTLLTLWPNVLMNYLNDRGESVVIQDIGPRIPRIARRKRTVVATYDHLPHAREPSRAALVNLLSRFHRRVAPIASARIAM